MDVENHIALGFLRFRLEPRDFDKAGRWHRFIDALKDRIPAECREYDADEKTWTIREPHIATYRAVYEEYFTDPNQLRLL